MLSTYVALGFVQFSAAEPTRQLDDCLSGTNSKEADHEQFRP